MRRFVSAFAIVIGATVVGCSSPAEEKVGSTSSAQTAEGAQFVTLVGFDRQTLVLRGVNTDGAELTIQYTADTRALPANLNELPPDPCFAQATAWNHQIGHGLTEAVVERLAHFAQFACSASVTLGSGGVALSFQPAASAPAP